MKKYKLEITPTAYNDLRAGHEYYSRQQDGLGKRFESAIRKSMRAKGKNPLAASIAYDTIRYKVVPVFPYVILYTTQANSIAVLRVFNTHQRPVI